MLLRLSRTAGQQPALAAALVLALAALAMLRPVNHDESQYVAAAILARAALPWRDFAYFQMPLQPLLLAPLAAAFGGFAWPGLRLVNALLAAGATIAVERAARAGGARPTHAIAVAALFAATDILLFSAGTARNDALPAAALAGALWLIAGTARGEGNARRAALIGFLLAGAVAAKISYVLPAGAYGAWAMIDRRAHRPGWVALGAAPIVALVAWLAAQAPDAAWFEVFGFPASAPRQMYLDSRRAWKLGAAAKAIDTIKFLALGAALPAIVAVAARWRGGDRTARLVEAIALAGLVAALLPEPTWRQYLLPALPPLFVALALAWTRSSPGRCERIAFVAFAVAGLAPSIEGMAAAARTGAPMTLAARDGQRLREVMDRAGVSGPVVTLSPQYLAVAGRLPDARFAAGPFYFRSHDLLSAEDEIRFHLVSAARFDGTQVLNPVLVGGDALAEGGDPALEARLAKAVAARATSIIRIDGGRFTIYVMPPLRLGCPPGSGCAE
ncbi:DUF2029 domain-containing protein [uncultured Sphingomonas sp.]|uniref:DUF2029 domain-containing protein n=1 Tax=uncultured Sphingomonas sp. TaxID=158754 RepID=UPI0035CA58B1